MTLRYVRMQKQWLLFYTIVLHMSAAATSSICSENRKIFTAKKGTIIHRLYKHSARCEFLIKGIPKETITLTFHDFHTECTYDHVFVHDGPSRLSKLLAVLTGQHDGIELLSSSHMVFVVVQSDDILTGKGFNLSYSINSCPDKCSNQGNCSNHECKCYGKHYGVACQHEWCLNFCNINTNVDGNKCIDRLKKCLCSPEFYGEACSLSNIPNKDLNTWHNMTVSSDIVKSRAGHVSAYIKQLNIMLVHGGYNFEAIYKDVAIFNFSSNSWTKVNDNDKIPPARFNHAGISHGDSLVIFGGELTNGAYSNELWLYNCSTSLWTQLKSNNYTRGLKLHTLTYAKKREDEEFLYVFGGQDNEHSLLSSQIYIFDLNKMSWSNPPHTFGKDLTLRVYGHSAVFYEDLRSIIIFGGFHAKISLRPGELTNRVMMYNIDSNVWSVIEGFQSDRSPPPIAYHTAVTSGNYMIIFGGLRFSDANICPLSNRMYYYNLHCGVWVASDILSQNHNHANKKWHPRYRFSHSAVMKDKQTLIITGGYDQANLLSDVVAYRLPEAVMFLDLQGREMHGKHCTKYRSLENCKNDPSCAYCSDQCVANKRNARCEHSCPRICEHFSSCETCTVQKIMDLRKQDGGGKTGCVWCTLSRTCQWNKINHCRPHKEDQDQSKCKLRDEKDGTGTWWESSEGKSLTDLNKCQTLDNRTGVQMIQFFDKKNNDYPDRVKILRSTSDITSHVKKIDRHQFITIKGIIYPYICYSMPCNTCNHAFKLDTQNAEAHLYLSDLYWHSHMYPIWREVLFSKEGVHQSRKPGDLFPLSNQSKHSNLQNYIFNLTVEVKNPGSILKILWHHTDTSPPQKNPSFHEIKPNYLQLYQFDICSNYTSCMGCITNSLCGWSHETQDCLLMYKYWHEHDEYEQSTICLAREESQCVKCDDYFDCNSCLKDKFCIWEKYKGCKRKDRSNALFRIKNVSQCNNTCKTFNNLVDCVKKGVACLWCSRKNICISHYEFHLHNQFGQCYVFELKPSKPCNIFTQNREYNCERSNCMTNFRCGWFYNASDPRIGRCTEGDFHGPYIGPSNSSISENIYRWAYDKCPDLDECLLGIDECKENSKCNNTYGSYECKCNKGFEGDGKTFCKKICLPRCLHGVCTKEIKCECDLGWKGHYCEIDCKCNNHSKCPNDTCVDCQNYTTGDHCQYCLKGAYGNATTSFGCKKCDCHGHGDPQDNYCNIKDGTCYCMNNTIGKHCEKCLPKFSHAPVEFDYPFSRRICHLNCKRSIIHFVNSSGWLVASQEGNRAPYAPYVTCLWVLTAKKLSHDSLIYNQTKLNNSIYLRIHRLKTSCFESRITIYDGVPPNPRTEKTMLKSNFRWLGSICNLNSKNRHYRSETGILSILYEGRTHMKKDDLPYDGLLNELLAEYRLLSCPDNCHSPFVCSEDMKCNCPEGQYGVLCEQEKCKNNCSVVLGGGTCDPKSFSCRCNFGFFGDDCSSKISLDQFSLEHINVVYNGINKHELERIGSSMVLHGKTLYIFGGTHIFDLHPHQPVFVKFGIESNVWEKVKYPGFQPSTRYGHCSFVYRNHVYIYGGVNKTGVLKDIWRFDIERNSWRELTNLVALKPLAGHSCTLVNDKVYIFGGYLPDEGLSNQAYILKLEGNNVAGDQIKFETGKLHPTGLYSYVAVYDSNGKTIYFHGGMAFFEEKVQPSHRIYSFNVKSNIWNYVEHEVGESVPRLVGHTGQLINGSLYLFGGYTDRIDFNNHIYIWKIQCNRWSILTVKKDLEGNGRTGQMFLTSHVFNDLIHVFGGFDDHVSSDMKLFYIPKYICGRHKDNSSCLIDDCNWCETKNISACFGDKIPSVCLHNASFIMNSNICHEKHIRNRECNSFTSCITCLGTQPIPRSPCQWCRCPEENGVCHATNDRCDCKRYTILNKCWETSCEASSCWNCEDKCIWTNALTYKSESKRILNKKGLHFNCFLARLIPYLRPTAILFHYLSCPRGCHSYSTCSDCLHDHTMGTHAGTKYCVWSDKLSECLSIPILPMKCSFGRCGQLYVPKMQNQCPRQCVFMKSCLSCIKNVGCGWCEQIGSKSNGTCMKGDLTGPYNSKCGFSGQQFLPSIVNVQSTSFLWTYASCPLKNECEERVHTCDNVTEDCHDLEEGYSCLCKDGYGYERSAALEKCKPICIECEQGDCLKPDTCSCHFGWTGKNCSVHCLCNGHSDCANASAFDICTKCYNNTQGNHCEECKPFFVGNPRNSGECYSCKFHCNQNADICVSKEEYEIMKKNYTVLQSIQKGPNENNSICVNCTNFSFGNKCEMCIDGYFKNNKNCTKCQCNGHSHTCNRLSGADCNCSHNTKTKSDSHLDDQCNQCNHGYRGNPRKGSMCYKVISQKEVERILVKSQSTIYFFVGPSYQNVNLKVNIDIYEGEADVYVTDQDERIFMEENPIRNTQTLTLTKDLKNITVNLTRDSHAMFTNYNESNTILIIRGVQHRLVIQIPHIVHQFRDNLFYVVISSVNKTKDVHGTFYFRQDQIKLNLTLFFLTLIEFLMFILTAFILGWKIHAEYTHQRRGNEEMMQMQTLAKRPYASYRIRCECNENIDIIRKRKDRNTSGKNRYSNSLRQNNNYSSKRITPLTVQNTEDLLASVVTVMVQYPQNEFSWFNMNLASGLFQANVQQVIQEKISHTSNGRKVHTRILSTQT